MPPFQEAAEHVSRDVHADAIRLQQAEIRSHLYWLLLPAAAWLVSRRVAGTSLAGMFVTVAMASSALVLSRLGAAIVTLRKLQRTNPGQLLDVERAAAQAERRDREDLRAHLSAIRPVVTIALTATIVVVTIVQQMVGVDASVEAAGLVKESVRQGEWWRLITASYLHGGALHIYSNAIALLVFGRLTESYDSRWRVPLVYMLSVIGSSLMSTWLLSASSIGASGGIMGLAGYLLVFGWRRPDLLPALVRRSLKLILLQTAIFGVVLFFIIDNAGHLGGALTGALIGLLLTPPAGAPDVRRATTPILDAAGQLAGFAFVAGAAFTVVRLLAA